MLCFRQLPRCGDARELGTGGGLSGSTKGRLPRMIISRTPFRISLFGGGTDYRELYQENGGTVIGTTINKYCYISIRSLPPFFEHRHRIVYSRIELPKTIEEIEHPAV